MEYLIGVDAGGTRTVAQAYDKSGNLLCEALSGPGNLTASFEQAVENITLVIKEILDKHKGDSCIYACIGCAGAETGDLKIKATAKLFEGFNRSISRIFVTNDAMLALSSALEGKNGVLIISGTGSIGYLKKGKSFARFGGWGHLLSDEGSGYYIGITAIRFICYSQDRGDINTPLKNSVFEALSITEHRQLIDFTYKAQKGEIAALSKTVEEAAAAGDPQAKMILFKAGEKLAYLAINLLQQNIILRPEIAISGSVLKKSDAVKQAFIETLNLRVKDYTLRENTFEPAKACCYLYSQDE